MWKLRKYRARNTKLTLHKYGRLLKTPSKKEDLIVPVSVQRELDDFIIKTKTRKSFAKKWGFFRKRVDGITLLFSGESGTGKTMAAQLIANKLGLKLYRIDLSQVVSKYIGETEKNLEKVFNVAERSGVILFFDEADSLFGKRTEVKDAHDRYANIEVSYLLQRMESYQGIAVLATNKKSNIDDAFIRRIKYVIELPTPDADKRKQPVIKQRKKPTIK
jgi:SpoVK/Ycf46/Vps4 family AAA+-type ATPase